MINTIGYLSALCFGLCGLPQAFLVWRNKTAVGTSTGFIILWTLGEIFAIVYVLSQYGADMPLLLNYVSNLIFLSVIIYYKIKDNLYGASR